MVWSVDFGLAAKVRPALLLTGNPADNELDLVTVLRRRGFDFRRRVHRARRGPQAFA